MFDLTNEAKIKVLSIPKDFNLLDLEIKIYGDDVKKFRKHIQVLHSDCTIISDSEQAISQAIEQLNQDLEELSKFTELNITWKNSYSPLRSIEPDSIFQNSVMKDMEVAVKNCEVGPMAAVAGALADRMKEKMLKMRNIKIAVVENGGEISIKSKEEIVISLIILSTSLKASLGFLYPGDNSNLGVATSSATFGHADSLGDADAVVVFAPNAAIADAAATRICNEVKGKTVKEAINNGINAYYSISELFGAFIVKDALTAKVGKIPKIVSIKDPKNELLKKFEKKTI